MSRGVFIVFGSDLNCPRGSFFRGGVLLAIARYCIAPQAIFLHYTAGKSTQLPPEPKYFGQNPTQLPPEPKYLGENPPNYLPNPSTWVKIQPNCLPNPSTWVKIHPTTFLEISSWAKSYLLSQNLGHVWKSGLENKGGSGTKGGGSGTWVCPDTKKNRLSCLRINTEKNTFFVFFPRFSNFFERVFALNNVFSFLEKITFWGEHLTKITCQIKFFQIYSDISQKRVDF